VRLTGCCVAHRDVEADLELRAEYGDRVPVILVDGCEYGFWRVEEQRFAGRAELVRVTTIWSF
jgi:hypothetical protein